MKKLITLFALGFILISFETKAQEFYGEFKAWGVFSVTQDGQKVCYITSTPTKKQGNYRKRGEPYALITYRENGISEVSFNSGYPYKAGGDVKVRIDNRHNYNFFTSSETPEMAWAKDSGTDRVVISKLKAGNKVTSKGYSKLGTYSLDTYSLSGFTAAYNKMVNACK